MNTQTTTAQASPNIAFIKYWGNRDNALRIPMNGSISMLHTSSGPKTIDRIIDAFPPTQQAQIRTQLSEALEAVITQTLLKKKPGGRAAALEIMVATTAVRNLIREAKLHQIPGIMQASQKDGMQTMDMALLDLATRGIVTKAEAQSCSMIPNLFGATMGAA